MSWNKKSEHPSKIAKVGDEVDVVVLDIKPSDRRVSLGIKQALPDPWLLTAEKYPVGTIVTGKVRNIAEFGAFIEIEDGFDGLVHVSDVSWTERIKNPHEVFKKGEPSYRESSADRSGESPRFARHQAGQRHLGRLVQAAQGRPDREGQSFAHRHVRRVRGTGRKYRGALPQHRNRGAQARRDEGPAPMHRTSTGPLKSAGPLEPGKEYDFKIIKISPETRRIGLSYRAAVKQIERREIEQYRRRRHQNVFDGDDSATR